MLDEVETWESKTGLDAIVGLNDEGRDRDEAGRSLSNPRLDVAFLDSGRYDEHVDARAKLKKPTLGIRNVDWNPETKAREYFSGERDIALNPDPAIASRTRRMFWRLFMAKAQMSAAYADEGRLAYRGPSLVGLDLWPFQNVARIVTASPWVKSWGDLSVATDLVAGSPTPCSYALDSARLVFLFLETMPGSAGVTYPPAEITVAAHPEIGKPDVQFLHPANAMWRKGEGARRGEEFVIQLPEFTDELMIVLYDSATDPQYTRVMLEDALRVEVRDGAVHLSWPRNPEGLIARVHRLQKDVASRGELPPTASLIAGVRGLSTVDEFPGPGEFMYTIVWKDEVKRQLLETKGVMASVPDRAPFTPDVRVMRVDASRAMLWAAGNLDPDIARVEWEKRLAGEGAWNAISGAEGAILQDVGLQRGMPLEYRARAVDAADHASEWSTPIGVTPESVRMPAAPGSGGAKVRSWVRKPLAIVAAIFAGLMLGVLWGRLAQRGH
jgi:hypothetical protein